MTTTPSYFSIYMAKRRKKRRDAGLCIDCDNKPEGDFAKCEECREIARVKRKAKGE